MMKEKRRKELLIYIKEWAKKKKYNNNIYDYFEDSIKINKDINIKERNNNKIEIYKRIIFVYIIINLIILSSNNITKYPNITLKIKGKGYNNIFTSGNHSYLYEFNSSYYPDEIYINGNKQNIVNYSYYFNDTDNYIELIWNNIIITCACMFYDCINITEIDLSHFDTSQVIYMNRMFYNCISLALLDLSHFDTSQVIYMNSMFYNCMSLTSLDLSNFDTSQVTRMDYIFYNCTNLEYINLNNFTGIKLSNISSDYSYMFSNIQENAVICINETDDNIKIVEQIKNIICHLINCENNWKLNQKKLNYNNTCIDNCYNDEMYKYEYNGKCYNICIYGYINDTACMCELEKCLLCSNVALYYNLCNKCNYNYYPKEDDINNIGEYINCYNYSIDGYYLDKNELIYKKCYISCKTCEIKGNNILHNCLTCKNNYIIYEMKNNYYNCYNAEIDNNIKEQDIFLNNIELEFISENYNTSDLDSGKETIIENDKMIITLTTSENQKNNTNNNMTSIDLGDCELEIRKYYNISDDRKLYIKKIDIEQSGYKIPKVEYDIYCKLNYTNLIKLNLSVCSDIKIDIYVPIKIRENLDKLNSSSGYYNDICYIAISDSGTDITLKDRKEEFINGNKTVCQDDCDFSNYNDKIERAQCSCKVKESSSLFGNMIIDKKKLYKNFIDVKNIANINLMVCYKQLFTKTGIINNIGCCVIISIILFHGFTFAFFYIKDISVIFRIIKNITFFIKHSNLFKEGNDKKVLDTNNLVRNTSKNLFSNNDNALRDGKKDATIKFGSKNKKHRRRRNINKNSPPRKKDNITNNIQNQTINHNAINININKEETNHNFESSSKKKDKKNKLKSKKKKRNEKIKNTMEFIDDEINNLSYDLALKYDKRTYLNYYCSLLRTKHIFIFSFFNKRDYNSRIIKIDLFFISFGISYVVNALFFNDETMHKIYESKGSFDFLYQIPQILYSSLISAVLGLLLNILALSSDTIIDFKKNKSKNHIVKKATDLKFKLKSKFILFFILAFVFLLFFWYYLSMFCVVYKKTQIHLIKDTLISFGLSLIYPFVICLIPGLFRIPALGNPKKKRTYLYKVSKLLQMM